MNAGRNWRDVIWTDEVPLSVKITAIITALERKGEELEQRGDGTFLPYSSAGTLQLGGIRLENVFLVPGLSCNLILVCSTPSWYRCKALTLNIRQRTCIPISSKVKKKRLVSLLVAYYTNRGRGDYNGLSSGCI